MSLFSCVSFACCRNFFYSFCRDRCRECRPYLLFGDDWRVDRIALVRLCVLFLTIVLGACHAPAQRFSAAGGSLPARAAIPGPVIPGTRSIIPAVTSPLSVLPQPDSRAFGLAGGLYTVSVNQVPASEVLVALARGTSLDMDISGNIVGNVTLNAVDQPLPVILGKIARQVSMRYEIRGKTVLVSDDSPFVQTYNVNYLNISRQAQSSVSLATQIGSLKTSIDDKASPSDSSNGSTMRVENSTENRFWDSLVDNIAGILDQQIEPGGANKASGRNIFVNRETGILSVKATLKQQKTIAALIRQVVGSAQRQVLIEATVVEIALSDNFESGVDWQMLDNNGGTAIDFVQLLTGSPVAGEATSPKTSILSYRQNKSRFGYVSATLKLLQQFGDVKVLSRPKIIAMNNQPAVLKVVDNLVYFTFEIDRTQRENGDERTIVDSSVHSVPVGLVMSVTPFIDPVGEVILNVRPTISRILNYASDPAPALAGQSEVRNLIPEIQVREMESLLRVKSGDVAIIGGLMQNRADTRKAGIPVIGRVPILGKIFSQSTKTLEKTELLVFLRPTVLHQTQQYGDLLGHYVEKTNDSVFRDGLSGAGAPAVNPGGLSAAPTSWQNRTAYPGRSMQ